MTEYGDPYTTGPALAAPEAERALLAAVITEPALAKQLLDRIQGPEFADPRHETIWHTYRAIVDTGQEPDIVAVNDHLRRADATDLMAYLPGLLIDGVALTQTDHYTNTVLDYHRRRNLDQLAIRLRQMARNGVDPYDAMGQAMDDLEAQIRAAGPRHTTKGHIDLTWLLSGQPPKIDTPEWVHRDDGIGLFYTGRVNGIYGDPETAKTWLAMLAIIQALANNKRAALIDLDHNGQQETTKRLMLLGADYQALADPDRFRYYEPGDGAELIDHVAELVEFEPKVAILDSLGELVPMLGGKSNDNDDITTAMRKTAVRLADTGACVIVIDHLPKSKEARDTGYAIGGTSKKRMTNGSYLEAKANKVPEPGGIGRINLIVSKDRSGGLRQHAPHKYAGTLVLDSTSTHTTYATIETGKPPPTTPSDKDLGPLKVAITQYMQDTGLPQSGRRIRDALHGLELGSDEDIIAATKELVVSGHLTTSPGQGRAIMHHLSAMYEDGGDDPT